MSIYKSVTEFSTPSHASHTDIFKVKLNPVVAKSNRGNINLDYILKTLMKNNAMRMKGSISDLEHEAKVYQSTNKLLEKRSTPNVLKCLGLHECLCCYNLITELRSDNIKSMFSYKGNFHQNTIFQVFYTLACFEQIGLSHLDMHSGNILLEDLKPTIPLIGFRIHKNYMIFLKNVNQMPYIFDFDRALKTKTKLDSNESKYKSYNWDYYYGHGNFKKDMFTFLCYLKLEKNHPINIRFKFLSKTKIEYVVDGKKETYNLGHRCLMTWDKLEKLLASPRNILYNYANNLMTASKGESQGINVYYDKKDPNMFLCEAHEKYLDMLYGAEQIYQLPEFSYNLKNNYDPKQSQKILSEISYILLEIERKKNLQSQKRQLRSKKLVTTSTIKL